MNLQFIREALKRFGVIISRSNYYSRDDLRLLRFLEIHQIDTVLDVGANCGDYAKTLIEGGFKGRVYSFEALPEMHAILVKRARNYCEQWIIAPCCAISDSVGIAKFNITSSNACSSLLNPISQIQGLTDVLQVVETVSVPTRTITDLCDELGIKSERMFLKLDIQGAEASALIGAMPMLERCLGLVVELSLLELYSDQALAREIHGWISDRGYDIWDIIPAWRDPASGRLGQIDVTYLRKQNK